MTAAPSGVLQESVILNDGVRSVRLRPCENHSVRYLLYVITTRHLLGAVEFNTDFLV